MLSRDILSIAKNLKTCVHNEGGNGAALVDELLRLPDFFDCAAEWGTFISVSGDIVDGHAWIKMNDDSIFDPNMKDMIQLFVGDERREHYHPYENDGTISLVAIDVAESIKANWKINKISEDWGGRPVGDPNSQSVDTLPDSLTVGGKEATIPNAPDEEFKPEEFEAEIATYMSEAKQVGIIYHFTDMHSAWQIMDERILKIGDEDGSFTTDGGMFIVTQPRTGISFTRNSNLKKPQFPAPNNEPWGTVRIAIDGNKLSEKYKVSPYLDRMHSIDRQRDNQAEEIINRKEVNISGVILGVDFNYSMYMKEQTDWDRYTYIDNDDKAKYAKSARDEASWFVRELRKLVPNFNIVTSFSTPTRLAESTGFVDATMDNIQKAALFVFDKWKERAAERGLEEPKDLTNACKFASFFAAKVFGGKMQGNMKHQYTVLNDNILDLTAGNTDYGDAKDPHKHDPKFWGNSEHKKSMKSTEGRVDAWVKEFKSIVNNGMLDEGDVVDLDDRRDIKNIQKFHSEFMGKISDKIKTAKEKIAAHNWSVEVGDKVQTQHGVKMNWPPIEIIGKFINKKGLDPSSNLKTRELVYTKDVPYVYYRSQDGVESSIPEWAIVKRFAGPIGSKDDEIIDEVDHPEYMTGGVESPTIDDNYDNALDHRDIGYNTGHPQP